MAHYPHGDRIHDLAGQRFNEVEVNIDNRKLVPKVADLKLAKSDTEAAAWLRERLTPLTGVCAAAVTVWIAGISRDPLKALECPNRVRCEELQKFYATKIASRVIKNIARDQGLLLKTPKKPGLTPEVYGDEKLAQRAGQIHRQAESGQWQDSSLDGVRKVVATIINLISRQHGIGHKLSMGGSKRTTPHAIGLFCWWPLTAYYVLDPNEGLYFYGRRDELIQDMIALLTGASPKYPYAADQGTWKLAAEVAGDA